MVGGGFWFEPFAYQPDLKYYGPYKYKDDKGKVVLTWEYSNEEYNYFKYDWYKKGLTTKEKIIWSEPYEDAVTGVAMITASSPIRKEGKVIGVTTVDVGKTHKNDLSKSIAWLFDRSFIFNSILSGEAGPYGLRLGSGP